MKNKKDQTDEQPPYEKKTYFIIGLTATAASIAAFGLAFTPLGIYALISSIVIGMAAIAFLNTQKKRNPFRAVFYATVAAYILTAFYLLFFLGGLIVSAG